MSYALVTGFTQADIDAAKAAAGPYGTVEFPPGSWSVSGLAHDVQGQVWKLTKGSTITRSGPGNLINCTGLDGKIVGGVWDGARDSGLMGGTNASGICGSVDFTLEDLRIQNVLHYGTYFLDGKFRATRVRTANTGYSGAMWQSSLFRSPGPLFEDCEIDRTAGYVAAGGIVISSSGSSSNVVVSPVVRDCKITLPQVPSVAAGASTYADAVCVEMRGASGGKIRGCTTTYGLIGISLVASTGSIAAENLSAAAFDYGLELAGGSTGNVLSANVVTYVNGDPAQSRGVSCSDASNGNRIADTVFLGCPVTVRMNTDSASNTVA